MVDKVYENMDEKGHGIEAAKICLWSRLIYDVLTLKDLDQGHM